MKWLLLCLVLVGAAAAADWLPVQSEIYFSAEVAAGVETGEYAITVKNDYGVPLEVSMGLNFESVPTMVSVEGFELATGYEGAEGAQYFAYFGLEPGEEKEMKMGYSRPNPGTENFWEVEFSYNSPVTLVFGAGDGNTYYESASYTGELVVGEVDLIKCRECGVVGGKIGVKGSKDFSADWSVQKIPVRPAVVYSVFAGFLLAFAIWEVQKWMMGGQAPQS